ncbi:8-oxo-dGTP diphosphatase [Collariella sp. IMI 366227]|nr:8-oxo-dGTP diphosphatase [Collariella sp. IMI 366227]
MNGSATEDQTSVHIGPPEHQEEVQTVLQGIQDLPASETALELPKEESTSEEEADYGSYYWNASTMAPLNAASALMRTKAAIARLRAYKPPPFPLWDRLPLSRRAAVLLLLYADRRGDLRVVITMRAASLRSFSGHAALPGGKADTLDETPYQIARREAFEEIGLPLDDNKLPAPFRIEHLCYLPMNLARTELVSRRSSAPFYNFLKETDDLAGVAVDKTGQPIALPSGQWYEGSWTRWHDESWRMHFFYVPVLGQKVVKPHAGRYKVWGMTARILVDAATVAYGEAPDFEHNRHFGDEGIIQALDKIGRMGEKKRQGSSGISAEDVKRAKEVMREAQGKEEKEKEGSKM